MITSTRDVCILPRFEQNPATKELTRVGKTLYIRSTGTSEDHSEIDLSGADAKLTEEKSANIATVLLVLHNII